MIRPVMGLLPEVANADRKIPRAAGADFFAERALFPWDETGLAAS